MRKFESDRAKSEEVIAKKQGLTGSEIHSSHGPYLPSFVTASGRRLPRSWTERGSVLGWETLYLPAPCERRDRVIQKRLEKYRAGTQSTRRAREENASHGHRQTRQIAPAPVDSEPNGGHSDDSEARSALRHLEGGLRRSVAETRHETVVQGSAGSVADGLSWRHTFRLPRLHIYTQAICM